MAVSVIAGGAAASNASSLPATQVQSQVTPVAKQVSSVPVEYPGTMDPKAIRALEETTTIFLSALATEADGT